MMKKAMPAANKVFGVIGAEPCNIGFSLLLASATAPH